LVQQVVFRSCRAFLPGGSCSPRSRAGTLRDLLYRLGASVSFPGDQLQMEQKRIVQAVEPDDWRSVIVMLVPRHRRRRNQIPLIHRQLLTLDDRMGSASFDDKPERGEVVTMSVSHFTSFQELNRH